MVIVILIMIATLSAQANEVKSMIKIPYHPKATFHCYESIKTAPALYRDAVAQMRSAIESQTQFEEKLNKVLALHQQVLESKTDSESEFQQIDVFLCCLYDMLQALYADESDKILASNDDRNQKKEQLAALAKSIEGLPFGGTTYRTAIRPKLVSIVTSTQKKLK
jgi:hypothetical protein